MSQLSPAGLAHFTSAAFPSCKRRRTRSYTAMLFVGFAGTSRRMNPLSMSPLPYTMELFAGMGKDGTVNFCREEPVITDACCIVIDTPLLDDVIPYASRNAFFSGAYHCPLNVALATGRRTLFGV